MEQLGLKSRETFRKNYMDPALNIGAVERTIKGIHIGSGFLR